MGAESDEPFLVNENCQRRDAGYQNVETQIPFEALDEKRVCDVPLDDHSLGERALVQLAYIVNQKNIATSRHISWFANPELFQSFLVLFFSNRPVSMNGSLSYLVVL